MSSGWVLGGGLTGLKAKQASMTFVSGSLFWPEAQEPCLSGASRMATANKASSNLKAEMRCLRWTLAQVMLGPAGGAAHVHALGLWLWDRLATGCSMHNVFLILY